MQPLISNPSSTIRRYSLFAEACDRETQAEENWRKAGAAYDQDRSTGNAVRLIQASIALKQAREDRVIVVQKTFPIRVEVLDGSDNTSTGSRRDAGFGDMGPF